MKLTPHLIAVGAALIAAALATDSWLASRRASAQLAATLASQNAVLAQATAQQHQRDSALAAALAEIAAGKSRVKTAQQAAVALPSVLPPLPFPVSVIPPSLTSPPTAPASVAQALAVSEAEPSDCQPARQDGACAAGPPSSSAATPTASGSASDAPREPAPGSLLIPPADLKPLYDALADCRACALQRDALERDLAAEQAKTAALRRERDAAITAVRGGPFWTRLRRAAKWFAIGAVVGATATGAASASRH